MLAACGGGAAQKAAPKQEAVPEGKAEKGAKDLLGEIHESIGHGDTDGLMTLLAEPLVVFGPRRADAMTARADSLVALKALVDPKAKKKAAISSSDLAVVPSPGGRSAWAYDQMSFGGQPLAVTVILSNTDDIWLVNTLSVAETPPMKTVRTASKQAAVVPTAMQAAAKLDPAAKAAGDKLAKGFNAQQLWGDDLAAQSDAIVIGPAEGDVTRGKADIKKLWKKRMKANVREAVVGEMSGGATPDGQLAWVTAPVVRFEDDEDPLPLRVFAVFQKSGGDWKLIALQEAVAIDQPGAGTTLKKTAAPPLPKAEEPPPPPPKKTPPAKKKKKKKKPASDD